MEQSRSRIVRSHWILPSVLAALVSCNHNTLVADEPKLLKVSGVLVDHDDRQPLPGMALALDFSDKQEHLENDTVCITDNKGRFDFEVPAALDPSTTLQRPPEIIGLPTNGEAWALTACDPGRKMPMFEMVKRAGAPGVSQWGTEKGRRTMWARVRAPGEIQAIVRDHDGNVLVDTDVLVAWNQGRYARVGWRGTTDAKGRFRLRCRAQNGTLFVLAPGRGCSFVTSLTVTARQLTRVDLPPLMPLARISGTVEADFAPGDEIEIGQFGWDDRHARLQPDGSFELGDVIPGFCQLRLRHAAGPASKAEHETLLKLLVSPGQQVTDLNLGAAERFPKPESLPLAKRNVDDAADIARRMSIAHARTKVFATGRVIDTRGQPIRGCRVIVTNQYHGGLRMVEKTVETRTDDDGTWRVDEIHMGVGSVMAAVFAPGRPVTYARGTAVGVPGTGRGMVIGIGGIRTVPVLSTETADDDDEPHVRADAIVSDRGGSITVRVLDQQQPATKGFVWLHLNDWYQRTGFGWARQQGRGERELRDSTWQFTQSVDAQGVARFENLPAGEYTAYAVDGTEQELASLAKRTVFSSKRPLKGRTHRGMVSVAGEKLDYLLQIGQLQAAVPLRVLGPDGNPIASQNVGINYQRLTAGSGRSTGRELDADGRVDFYFDTPGLWRMALMGRSGGVHRYPVRHPDFSATTFIGVSSLLSPQHTREIRLSPNHRSPDAMLRLLDRDGRAARAFVRISDVGSDGLPVVMGATDSNGEFRLSGFDSTRNHDVVVWFADSRPLPSLSIELSDEQLLASRGPQFSKSFFRHGEQVEVREEPQSYVRGRASFPPGLRREHYRLDVSIEGASHDFDPTTGDFLIGPLSTHSLRLIWRHRGTPQNVDAVNAILLADVSVEPDFVTHADVEPQPVRREELWMARKPNWQPVSGRVWLFEKGTPAANTRFAAYAANTRQPVSAGCSDPLGRFHTAALHVFGQQGDPPIDGNFTGPILVAWIPGKTGRVIVPLTFAGGTPDDLDIVLPRGHRVAGRASIAGEPALNVAAPVTIALRLVDNDRRSSLLSQQATTNADGTFEFAGLTAGHYVCQAALDNLWLSPTVEVNVTGDLRDLALNIPKPGGTARLLFNHRDGSAWRRQAIEVDWPEGPLTSQLRPAVLTTDDTGNLFLDGAPVGPCRVRLRGEQAWHTVRIQSHSRTAPKVQIVKASLDQ